MPGIFVPVEIDGRLLVDGALVENVPVRPLRALGAAVVVGVSVLGRPPHRPVRTTAEILTNAAVIVLQDAVRRPPPEGPDVLVEPDLGRHAPWSLRSLPALYAAGQAAGERAAARIAAARIAAALEGLPAAPLGG